MTPTCFAWAGGSSLNTFLNTSFTENLEDWRAKRLEQALIHVKDIEKKSFGR